MGVGLKLKALLRDRKMTIKQLAKQADIPVNTLYSITKRDSERVDVVILQRIAAILKVNWIDLVPEGSRFAYIAADTISGTGLKIENPEQYEDLAYQIKQEILSDAFTPEEYEEARKTKISDIQTDLLLGEVRRIRMQKISELFSKLNAEGQQKAVERVEELTEIPKYQRKSEAE